MSGTIHGGTLTPAYGRDYRSKAAIVEDLNAGLDFMLNTYGGSRPLPCSLSDLADGSFQVRDRSLRKLWVVAVKGGVAK